MILGLEHGMNEESLKASAWGREGKRGSKCCLQLNKNEVEKKNQTEPSWVHTAGWRETTCTSCSKENHNKKENIFCHDECGQTLELGPREVRKYLSLEVFKAYTWSMLRAT